MFHKREKIPRRVDLPNLTIYYLLKEITPLLENSFINKVQELENNWIKLKLRSKDENKDLIITPNAFFFSDYKLDAKQETAGFGAFLRKYIEGKKIIEVKQHEVERVVKIFAGNYCVLLELFSSGNILLLDSNESIMLPLKKEEWASRELKKGESYVAPPALGKNPLTLSEKEFKELLSNSPDDTIHALIKNIALAPVFLEEVCFNTAMEKTLPAKELKEKQIKQLFQEIKALFSQGIAPVLIELNNREILLPFSLNFCKTNEKKFFASMNSAVDELFSKSILEKDFFDESFKIRELTASLERQKQALVTQEEFIESSKKKAEVIYANFLQVNEALQAIASYRKQKLGENDIMYKLKSSFPFVKEIDLKKKTIAIELD